MATETFNYPYHTPQNEYQGGYSIKFGRGYRFAARPTGPEEVIIHLNFPAMFVFEEEIGHGANADVEPTLNIYSLMFFYTRHLMYKPFFYNDWIYGQVVCRFNKPLIMPKTLKTSPGEVGGRIVDGKSWRLHQVEPFDIELLRQP